jgi:hypothetical protein
MEALGSGFKRSASKVSNVNKSKTVVIQSGGESSAADSGSSLKKIPKIAANESDVSNNNSDSKKISSAQNNSLSRVIQMKTKT